MGAQFDPERRRGLFGKGPAGVEREDERADNYVDARRAGMISIKSIGGVRRGAFRLHELHELCC
jgi:hypothetical protein